MDNFTLGQEFKAQYSVSHEVYYGFLGVFKDHNPMHTDADYAVNYGFDNVVMHGNILNGFLSHFIGEMLPIKNVIITSQQIKFRNPIYLNDSIELLVSTVDIHETFNLITFKYQFINVEKTVCATGSIQIQIQ